MAGIHDFLLELRRRRVFRVTGMYVVAAWVGVQVASLVFPAIDIAEAALRYVWIGFILAFPLVMVFAWLYDVTPHGIVRTPPAEDHAGVELRLRRSDYVILACLVLVTAAMTYQLGGEIRDFETAQDSQAAARHLEAYTVAVLPLENVADDESRQFFADGMHEALISVLSGISALKVISRTSTRRYMDTDKTVLEVGRELGAANIIEGSVLRQGENVRITVQLIDAASGQLRWSRMYERKVEDVLRLQSDLAQSIAGEIQVLLTPEETAYLEATAQVVPAAYEDYLKGRFHWYRLELDIALEYFRSALEKDPGYALAYVGYADALATRAHIGLQPAGEVFPRAKDLVEKALELDPLLAEAHDFLARLRFTWDYDWLAADRGFRESIRLKPSYPDARIVYSQFLGILGRWEESLEQVRAGLSLDPYNDWFRMELGSRLAGIGSYEEALEEYLVIRQAQPNWFMVYRYLWEVHFYRDEPGPALEAAVNYYALSGEPGLAEVIGGFDGRTEFTPAMLALASELTRLSADSHVSELELARIFAFAGDPVRTLDWLELAYENRDSQLVYSTVDPLFALVWEHPRFARLRLGMNLPARRADR